MQQTDPGHRVPLPPLYAEVLYFGGVDFLGRVFARKGGDAGEVGDVQDEAGVSCQSHEMASCPFDCYDTLARLCFACASYACTHIKLNRSHCRKT